MSAIAEEHLTTTSGRDVAVLAALATGFVMAMIDLTAVNLALPAIAQDLSVPLSGLVWVVDGYTLTFAALLLAGGALADRLGAKRVYQAGLVVFLLGSIACALASSGVQLTVARFVQGSGAALFMPSSLALVGHAYPATKLRIRMVGIWSAMVGASSAVGPLVGGALVSAYGWRAVFWVNIPLGLIGLAMVQVLLSPPSRQRNTISMVSHGLAIAVLSALTYALIEGPARGWTSTAVALSGLGTVAGAWMLRYRDMNGIGPLVPSGLRRTGGFVAINTVGFLINCGAFGQLFFLSLYLQQAMGLSALGAGMHLLPLMITVTVGNLASSRVSARLGLANTMKLGLAVGCAVGLVVVSLSALGVLGASELIACVSVMNLAIGTAIPAMTASAMQIAGQVHANSAAAALNANRQIGALVGVAAIGSVLHAVPVWNRSVPIAFVLVAAAYGIALVVVRRSLSSVR